MIDPDVFDESVERAVRKHCGTTFDKFIAALVGFGCGVFFTGMAMYWLS
jgi:hypothetical protein